MSSSDDDDVFGAHQSGAADLKGRRSTMEDAHINEPELEDAVSGSGLYAVFDGHGGSKTSDWVAKNFASAFVEHPGVAGYPPDIDTAFKDVFSSLDETIIAKMVDEGWSDGSTGAVCFTDPRTKSIHTANVGDSEVFVIRKGEDGSITPLLLSVKHRPGDAEEQARIQEAGGVIVFGRIMGSLAVARAFGDKDFKFPHNKSAASFVSVEPHTSTHVITDDDQILVICCDGMFEKLTYAQVAECIWERRLAGDAPAEAAKAAVRKSFESGSTDNISCVLVYLRET